MASGKRRTEYRDRRSEHDPGLVAAANETDSIQQHSRAIEIDPVALVEIELGLAGDDRRQMKDHVGTIRNQLCGPHPVRRSRMSRYRPEIPHSPVSPGRPRHCRVSRVMSRLPSRPSRSSRSLNLRPTMPAAPRTNMCKTQLLLLRHSGMRHSSWR